MGQKKLVRKAEPPSNRRIAWPKWTGFRAMTLRDWLPIVIAFLIPVVIAAGTGWITWQQGKLENQRAEDEQELAEQRAQDEALQVYLDQMSSLLLENNLRDSAPDSEIRSLAQTRTLTLLDTVDSERRRDALRFLYETDLIDRANPVISLHGANLQNMDLRLVNLGGGAFDIPTTYGRDRGAEWGSGGVDVSGADLSGTDLSYGSLEGSQLEGADFRGADLTGCGFTPDLSNVSEDALGRPDYVGHEEHPPDAPLDVSLTIYGHVPKPEGAVRANLEGAFFNNATVRFAVFQNADLAGADFIGANLRSAWLVNADLNNAAFTGADLSYANLAYARLTIASFKGADLTGANLENAFGLEGEELEEQAKSLKGATMPNGQQYEEWLKSREEDREKAGPL